jgi:macrodomain Ter protein organizer (MatP/YcbG family)
MKTLIEVDRRVWGKVKQFASVRGITLNKAVESLLISALSKFGYSREKQEERIHGQI